MGIAWVNGTVNGVSGEIEFDPENPESASFKGELDVSTINTGMDKRDMHLKGEEFFDVENHPTMKFETKNVEIESDQKSKVTGELTIKDTTKDVVLDVNFNGTGERPDNNGDMEKVAAFTIETTIDRTDFGLDWNMELPGQKLLVGNEVRINVEIEAVLQE
jgi:polyisoprenoid-binding protein YceI